MVETSNESAGRTIIDFSEIFDVIWAEKYIILLFIAVGFCYGKFQSFKIASKLYKVDTLVQVDPGKPVPGVEEKFIFLNRRVVWGEAGRETILMKSRTVMLDIVEELNLNIKVSPVHYPRFGIGKAMAMRYEGTTPAPARFGMEEYAWGGEKVQVDRLDISDDKLDASSSWHITAGENGMFTLFHPSGAKVLTGEAGTAAGGEYNGAEIEIYISRLTARPKTRFVVSKIPQILAAKDLAEQIDIEELGKFTGLLRISMIGKNVEFIKRILDTLGKVYLRRNISERTNDAEKMIEHITKVLPKYEEKLELAEDALQEYIAGFGTKRIDLSLEAQEIIEVIKESEKELSELKLQLVLMKSKYTDEHPLVKSTMRKIAELEEQRAGYGVDLEDLPAVEREFARLIYHKEQLREVYHSLINKRNSLALAKEGTPGNITIVDPAENLHVGVNTGAIYYILYGILGGFVLGFLWAVGRKILSKTVKDINQLEKETGLSVFGSIPRSSLDLGPKGLVKSLRHRAAGGIKMVAHSASKDDPAVEGLRSLRTSLQFALKAADNNIVVFSGPLAQIGKSFISINFAAVMAEADKKVLLIDGDMRRGHLNRSLGLKSRPGLSELISKTAVKEDVIKQVSDNMYFIPHGKRPPNPSELLLTERFSGLLKDSSREFDVVIIDTPPILLVTDASIISQYASQLLLVSRYGKSKMHEVKNAISRFVKDGIKVSGIIVNYIPPKAGKYYGYGYYGYQYKTKKT